MTKACCQYCPCLYFTKACALALSPSGTILKITQSLAESLGYHPKELEGKLLSEILPADFLQALAGTPCAELETDLKGKAQRLRAHLFICQRENCVLILVQPSAQQRLQRDLLLREVHHRIKNNLQGIAGLLYNQALAHPELAPVLETPIRQIHSIALLYGLRSQGEENIFLCQLCQIIAQAGQGLSHIALTTDIPYIKTIQVHDEEAVTIALILNELLVNAIKHGSGKITLALRCTETEARVLIRNPCAKPLKLNLAQGRGLGTGLQLVQALLPKDGSADLTICEEDGYVVTTLRLRPPVVRMLA